MRGRLLNTSLRNARLAKGLTQKRLASLIGLTLQGYWDIEHGRTSGSVKVWDRLEVILEKDQRELRQIGGRPRKKTADKEKS